MTTTTLKTKRVFFAHVTRKYDTRDARRFGERVFLLAEDINPMRPEQLLSVLKQEIRQYNFDPETDFVALTGDSRAVSLMVGIISGKCKAFNLLIWNAKSNEYIQTTLNLGD